MTFIEKLGNKCTNTICHKECPIWWFNHRGAGAGCGNNCVEAMRFRNVAEAVKLWISGKEWDKGNLAYFVEMGEDDE